MNIDYEHAIASLCILLRKNYAKLDSKLEDSIWKDFFDYSNLRDLAAEPDSYNYDFDYDNEMRDSKAYAHKYCNPVLPSLNNLKKCYPCPNAACPYINTEERCPLKLYLSEMESHK